MRSFKNKHLWLLFFGFLISIVIRAWLILNSKHVADIELLYLMGNEILRGNNPYISLDYNIYPPLALYLEAITIHLSNFLKIPFYVLTRVWPNLADLVIGILLFKFLTKLNIKPIIASFWSLVFVLNPISIIISAAHGQIDSIPSLFLLLTIYYLYFYSSKFYIFLAALMLGVGIAVKPNPLMLLPFFLFTVKYNTKKVIIFLIFSLLPISLLLIPFLIPNFVQVISKVLTYSGVYDFSLAGIVRSWIYQDNANHWLQTQVQSQMLLNSKISFLGGAFFLFVLYLRSKELIKALLSVYLLFLGVYFGISAQYLIWVLPLAIIERSKIFFAYCIVSFISLLGFYLFFGPEILLGRYGNIVINQSKYMTLIFIGNVGLYLVVIFWLTQNIIKMWRVKIKNSSKIYRSFLYFSLTLFIILLLPTIQLIVETVSF